MKLVCPKCEKVWDEFEVQNQVCNSCGATGSYNEYDEEQEKINIRMEKDPQFAEQILNKQKIIKRKNRRTYFIYVIIGIISYSFGFNYLHDNSRLWFWGGIIFAMIIHSIYNKYSKN